LDLRSRCGDYGWVVPRAVGFWITVPTTVGWIACLRLRTVPRVPRGLHTGSLVLPGCCLDYLPGLRGYLVPAVHLPVLRSAYRHHHGLPHGFTDWIAFTAQFSSTVCTPGSAHLPAAVTPPGFPCRCRTWLHLPGFWVTRFTLVLDTVLRAARAHTRCCSLWLPPALLLPATQCSFAQQLPAHCLPYLPAWVTRILDCHTLDSCPQFWIAVLVLPGCLPGSPPLLGWISPPGSAAALCHCPAVLVLPLGCTPHVPLVWVWVCTHHLPLHLPVYTTAPCYDAAHRVRLPPRLPHHAATCRTASPLHHLRLVIAYAHTQTPYLPPSCCRFTFHTAARLQLLPATNFARLCSATHTR